MDMPHILLSGNQKLINYAKAVELVGGKATATYLPDISTEYDGLILCGGNDIDPSRFGESINGATDIDFERDRVEFALLQAFINAKKPVLGICRGCQLINVFFGGTLTQDIHTAKNHRASKNGDAFHTVLTTAESSLKQLYGDTFTVNSAHHQAICQVGEGLTVTTINPVDGIVEAIEHNAFPIFAVQWHPERICGDMLQKEAVDGIKIFEHFIKMCQQ